MSWEEFFQTKEETLPLRILWHISNLMLLHKSKEEARIDQLQLQAQFAEDGQDTEAGERVSGGDLDMSDDEDWQGVGATPVDPSP